MVAILSHYDRVPAAALTPASICFFVMMVKPAAHTSKNDIII